MTPVLGTAEPIKYFSELGTGKSPQPPTMMITGVLPLQDVGVEGGVKDGCIASILMPLTIFLVLPFLKT